MLILKLKFNEVILGTLEDWEGTQHTDGIAWSTQVIGNSIVECNKIHTDGDNFAFETIDGVYLSHKWLSKVNNITIKKSAKITGDKYITLDDVFIDINSLTVIPKSELDICECCGAISSHVALDGTKICNSCLTSKYGEVKGYNFKPTPIFFGTQLKADDNSPIHYGLELEYGYDKQIEMALLVMNSNNNIYLKSDSSIRGGNHQAELVTHPMSYDYIMNEAKWLDTLPTIEAKHNPTYNGCHIHISRTAFVDDKHYSLFYFMMHNMYDILQFVGGREFTDYCRPKAYGKVFTKGKGSKDNHGDTRSVMLNESNDATIEARFFASTDKVDDIKMYVQLLESVIKYTKYKTNCTVTGWEKYVQKYSTKYNFLNIKLGQAKPEWFIGNVAYRAPRVITKDIHKITADKLSCITTIKLVNGKVLENVHYVKFDNSSSNIRVSYNKGQDGTDLQLSDIAYCTWEE